jgi:hypothetical protein
MGNFLCVIAVFLFLLPAEVSLAQSFNIISPSSEANVSSPVRVVAEFPSATPISSITISVDNVEVQDTGAVTPLDVSVPMAEGSHLITIKSVQADGTVDSASRWVNVSAATATANTANASSSTTSNVHTKIEEKSGWYSSPDQGNPVCSSTPALVSNPSMDGISGKFYLGPTGQYNNCLWPITLGKSSTVSNFTLDTYYQLTNPGYSQGLEFSHNHHVGTKWYKFSVQCSYNKGVFSIWDTAGKHWVATKIACNRPKANSWNHLVVNTKISGGKAVFLSLTLNGVLHSINQSFNPLTKASSYSYGVHFQMNGDISGHSYYAWVDKFTFKAW